MTYYYNENESDFVGADNVDTYARDIMIQAWNKLYGRDPTLAERQLSQAVGRLETYYGRAGQFKGSHNWGAVQHSRPKDGQCPPGSFLGRDTLNGTKATEYPICERSYPNDLEGATHMLKILSRTPQEKAALQSGSAKELALAMKKAGYYGPREQDDPEGYRRAIINYHKALWTNSRDIAKNCGENLAVTNDGSSGSSSGSVTGGAGPFLALAAVGAGIFFWTKRGKK